MSTTSLKTILITQFDHETATARKLLQRVPMDKWDWKPHEKSTPLGKLALHVAQLPGMGVDIITKDLLSLGGGAPSTPPEVKTAADLVALFDGKVKATRDALEATTDENLSAPWKFTRGDRTIFEGNRVMAFQSMLLNHFIHHRAQLGVYLRLNDVAIPGSYGPSTDEPM